MLPKSRGCLVMLLAGVILWFAIGWVLWQWALQAPAGDPDSPPFELIPKSQD